jgi:hypothetical protein
MNPSMDFQLAGQAHVGKLRIEACEDPDSPYTFAAYDALDEPVWAWQVAKHLLTALKYLLTASQRPSTPGNFAITGTITEAVR